MKPGTIPSTKLAGRANCDHHITRSFFRMVASPSSMTADGTLNVYTQVLDGSVRDAVEKIGGELFTIVHRPARAGAVTA